MADSISALEFFKTKIKLGENYLVLGADAYLADIALAHIKRSLKPLDIDVSIVYGDTVRAGELGEYLDTFTIFSSTKLVIIRNAEALGKNELEVVGDYFDNPSDIQSLAIIAQKSNKTLKAWKKIHSGSQVVSCDPPRFAGDMRNWLMTEIRKMEKVMTPQAISEFTARIELDYYTASNELNKIGLLVGSRKQITADDLQSLSSSRAGTLIDFYRALGKKQVKSALGAMNLMLDADWEPLQILFSMLRFYSKLWNIQLLRNKHIADPEISMRHLGDIYMSQRKEYLGFAKNYPIPVLERIMELLLQTDYNLKSSSIDKRLQLDLSVIKILGQA